MAKPLATSKKWQFRTKVFFFLNLIFKIFGNQLKKVLRISNQFLNQF